MTITTRPNRGTGRGRMSLILALLIFLVAGGVMMVTRTSSTDRPHAATARTIRGYKDRPRVKSARHLVTHLEAQSNKEAIPPWGSPAVEFEAPGDRGNNDAQRGIQALNDYLESSGGRIGVNELIVITLKNDNGIEDQYVWWVKESPRSKRHRYGLVEVGYSLGE